ncbi:hypothetical protein [Paraburkholderia sp.]|uniref:hypothetical protein n=1 Tax=Paraburkholderia sp. TaxID=1926495 RepID=UPI002388F728|nr:hypothetical protein [Paraburkholderia sp.]MDE1184762.1 hypothetical protein [Paraburkholderia sp.]
MITDHARRSIEAIFCHAARSRLTLRAGDRCETVAVDLARRPAPPGKDAVVLTISAIAFRLLIVLHFNDDEATRRYYVGDNAERTVPEVLMEVANLCCGFVNQQLVTHFPDLGMSTPYALSSLCVDYLEELKPDCAWAFDIVVDGDVQLGATLCVCANAPLDFVATIEAEASSEGELELF